MRHQCRALITAFLFSCLSTVMILCGHPCWGDSPPHPLPQFTRIGWGQVFVGRKDGVRSTDISAYAPHSSLMALVARVWGVTASELWVADLTWTHAQHLTTHTGGSLTDVAWSPDEKNLAFVGWPSFLSNGERFDTAHSSGAKLFVVARQSGHKTLIAQGAVAPRWTPDGKFLLFLRFIGGKWQPYRASHFSSGPKLEAVSDLMLDQPGTFNSGGSSVAGGLGYDLVHL
jgi:hypothetical protein